MRCDYYPRYASDLDVHDTGRMIYLSIMESDGSAASMIARDLLSVRDILHELNLDLEEIVPLRVGNHAAGKQCGREITACVSLYCAMS